MGKIKAAVKKYGKYAVGAAALGGLAYGGTKLIKGLKGRGKISTRSRGVGRLKSQVMRLSLKIKKKQLQRKLFKEEMRL